MGKILFIGCGRRGGNTYQAARVAASAAQEAGAETLVVEAIRLHGIGRGCHSCMTARGIKNANAKTVTGTYMGEFRRNAELKELIKFD